MLLAVADKQCILVCAVCVEDSDFVAHGSGSEDALELVIMHRTSVLAIPTTDMMSLQRIVMRIKLLLKRNHAAVAANQNHQQAPREAKQYVVKHNKHLATRSLDFCCTL